MYKMKCVGCGNTFNSEYKNTKYCSKPCRKLRSKTFSRAICLDDPELTVGNVYEYFIRKLDSISPLLDEGDIKTTTKEIASCLDADNMDVWDRIRTLTGQGLLKLVHNGNPSIYRVYRRRKKYKTKIQRATEKFNRNNFVKPKHKKAYYAILDHTNQDTLFAKFTIADIPQKEASARLTLSELNALGFIKIMSEKDGVVTVRILLNDATSK